MNTFFSFKSTNKNSKRLFDVKYINPNNPPKNSTLKDKRL